MARELSTDDVPATGSGSCRHARLELIEAAVAEWFTSAPNAGAATNLQSFRAAIASAAGVAVAQISARTAWRALAMALERRGLTD